MYDYSDIDKIVEEIIQEVCGYMKNLNNDYIREEILSAYLYARDAHEWDFRHSWEPYIVHPVEATKILISLKPDILTIQTCFLHDVIEDTPKTEEDIRENFWDEVAFLCVWLEKLSKVRYKWEEREVGSMRKMFIAMAEDLRVVFVKLSDRLHNMQTLMHHPKKEKREKIALETLNIYAPIADRLGLYHIKNALDEECFKVLDLENYENIKAQLLEIRDSKVAFVDNVKKEIDHLLEGTGVHYEIDYRVKSIYSIYRKMQKKWLEDITNLYDLFWIRIIVDTLPDCYKALGLIHNKWTPLPYRFKDYIALPKPNGYKSIHTTVVGLLKQYRKQPTEIQIKTFKMKEYSDIWVAAHFEYKEKWSEISADVNWVRELKELTQSLSDNDLIGSLKIDVFKNRIYIFTPKWDFINLPHGSTPVDFAYYVHTDLWNHISMAKVNGKIYPLDKWLHNGDVVEIIIDKNKKPNPFWISFLKTLKAKNAVKSYMKLEDKVLHRDRGKDIMNKYLEKLGLGVFDKDITLLKVIDGKENSTEERLQLLEQVWNFSITPNVLLKRILKSNKMAVLQNLQDVEESKEEEEQEEKENQSINDHLESTEIVIGWEEDMKYRVCNCCGQVMPAEIVAHINHKWKITIHRRDCVILEGVNKERLLPAYLKWDEHDKLTFALEFVFKNKIWILRILTKILFGMNIDVDEIHSRKINSKEIRLDVKLIIPNHDYLLMDRLIDRIKLGFEDDLISTNIKEIES